LRKELNCYLGSSSEKVLQSKEPSTALFKAINGSFLVCAAHVRSQKPTNSFYLWLISYGMPSALGALDFFEVNARTTIVAAYGSIL